MRRMAIGLGRSAPLNMEGLGEGKESTIIANFSFSHHSSTSSFLPSMRWDNSVVFLCDLPIHSDAIHSYAFPSSL